MKSYLNRLIMIVLALISPIMAGATTAPAISISPGYSTIGVSTQLQYTATVSGLTNTAVTWQVNGIVGGNATLGTITATGLYSAPATVPAAEILVEAVASNKTTMGEVYVVIQPAGPTITAVSPNPIPLGNYKITLTGSGFKSGTSVTVGSVTLATSYVNPTTVTVMGYQGAPGTASIQAMNPGTLRGPTFTVPFAGSQSVSPSNATMVIGKTLQFTSTGATSWTATAGTISASGFYTAPSSLPSNPSVTITAKGPGGSGTATVTLVPVTLPIISSSSSTVILGKTLQFTSAGAINWSASVGTINSAGLYTAPSTMPSSPLVTITANGTNGTATTTVTLLAPQVISPASASVLLGKTQQFIAAGASSWTATAGTINSAGLYTAPSTMPSSGSVTVTATGLGGSASATVALIAPQTISPSSATATLGQTLQFTSVGATTWSTTAGSITSSGLYTAPATTPASGSATVTASGPGGSASATVTFAASLTISPATASVTIGQTLQFTSVGATSWTATGGSISSTGLYTAPATMPGSAAVTVTATGPNGSASAAVTLVAPAQQTISPQAATVGLGKTQQFASTGATSWTASAGSISSTGLYTAPAVMPASTIVTVTATGPGGSATASVTLSGTTALSVSPSTVTLLLGQSQQFTAPGATGWFANSGTITSTGLYTAPATMPSASVVAILVSGPNGSAVASVTLVNPNQQTISPTAVSVTLGQTQLFTSPGATSWTASAGSISANGLFTAPATMPASSTVSITATGPTGSATALVSLTNPAAQAISPTSANVTLGQTQQFTSSGATGWVASAGTVTSTGLYTAPTTMPASSAVSVTATGPNGSATASITLVSPGQSITPVSVSVLLGQTQQFTSSGATSWTASVGTISSTGLFTAPTTMPAVTTAAITATGPYGSATATVILVAAQLPSGQVSISTEAPLFGWQLIPGATRRIHATVTNGSTNEVTWSYTTTGGASATITPAPSPNILGAFVDVTLGSVGSTCKNIGTVASPVFQSAASVTLTATSVDDPTQSTSVPINICNPTVQTYVSPFNVRLYSGQTVDLQSWVWGSANDNVTWSVTSQPSGGNGTFAAPPAGGSATTARDAVFSATVAGDYVVTATSVANPSASASAIVSVDSAALPYSVTPNHTAPVDCSVDPTQAGKTYDVGAGHPYAMLADAYVAIGSNNLSAGTTIRLFNTDTTGTNPTHFHEYLRLDGQGTQAAPIRIVGCADSLGNLPVLDGTNATSYSPTDNSVNANIAGLYQIGIHHSGVFGVYPTINSPSYIIIEGLAFRNAYPTLPNGTTNSYYNPGSATATQWPTSGATGGTTACIRPYEGNHLTVRGNDMEDCSFGILGDFNGNNGWGGFFGDFDLEGNYFTNIGSTNQSEHMAYVQGFRQVIQGNVFDQLKSVSAAGELKMRGVAEVVRYNFFNTSTNTRTIDFVEEQDSNMYMSFPGYYYIPSGSESFAQEYPADAYTPDMIAAGDEAWHKAYAYGNTINFGPTTPTTQAPIHFFGDQGVYADVNTNPPVRVGDLFDYNNTIYSVGHNSLHFVDTMQNQDNMPRSEWPTLTLWNNAMYVGPLNTAGAQDFQMSTLRSDNFNLGPNWLSSNWGNNTLTCSNNTGNACTATGWPWQMETTQYMDGGNLPAHITGLSNLIIGGSTVPFSTTTFIPTSGGGLVGAGAPLPSTISNMPVRFELTAPGYALTPRTNPLTLGAHD